MRLCPKNWQKFQHYRNRKPPWIKLHRELLDDYEFRCLPVASRALAPLLWLLASEYENGVIEASEEKLAFRLHLSIKELREAVKPLIDNGFMDDASTMLARCKQDAILEKERETEIEVEEERELEGRAVRSRTKPCRLPEDWTPRDHAGLSDELAKFRDYWRSAPGSKGVKQDWDATWRNWVRRSGVTVALSGASLAPVSVFIDQDSPTFARARHLCPEAKVLSTKKGRGIYVSPEIAREAVQA